MHADRQHTHTHTHEKHSVSTTHTREETLMRRRRLKLIRKKGGKEKHEGVIPNPFFSFLLARALTRLSNTQNTLIPGREGGGG